MPNRAFFPEILGVGRRGFTLVEVMVVVAILAILAAIAIPSYVDAIQRGARKDARAMMSLAAQWMERNRSESGAYNRSPNGTTLTALPTAFQTSPESGTARYNLGFATGSLAAATFTVQAVPTGPQANDECGTLALNQLGQRSVDPGTGAQSSGALFDRCWGR